MIELILMLMIACLWFLGGQKQAYARDIGIPVIVGVYFIIKLGFIEGLLLAGASNIIRMGYGNYDPINDDTPSFWALVTRDSNGWWIRAIVGAMYGVSISSVILFFDHSFATILKCFLYTVHNSLACFMVSRFRLPVIATDIIVGLSFGSLILWF